MISQIQDEGWILTQTADNIKQLIEEQEQPQTYINHLISKIYDEAVSQAETNHAGEILRLLDISSYSIVFQDRIQRAVNRVFDADDSSSYDMASSVEEIISDDEETQSMEGEFEDLPKHYLLEQVNGDLNQVVLRDLILQFVKNDDILAVKITLGEGASVETKDPESGDSLLCLAARNKNEEIFLYLLTKGAHIDVTKEPICQFIEEWIEKKKYNQLRELLKARFDMDSYLIDRGNFLNFFLAKGGNVAHLVNPMSEGWKHRQTGMFLNIPEEEYVNMIPADFVIVISIESYRETIIAKNNLDFLQGNLLIFLAQFMSGQKNFELTLTLLTKLRFEQQICFFDGLEDELERMVVRELYLIKLGNLEIPRKRFENRLDELIHYLHGDQTPSLFESVNNLTTSLQKGSVDKKRVQTLLEWVSKSQEDLNRMQFNKLTLWNKQSNYLSFWIDSKAFNIKKVAFKSLVKDFHLLKDQLQQARKQLSTIAAIDEEERIYDYQEKGEILGNAMQFNAKIKALQHVLKKIPECDQEFISDNFERLYNLFYSNFEDERRYLNPSNLQQYAKELRIHLNNFVKQQNIISKPAILEAMR